MPDSLILPRHRERAERFMRKWAAELREQDGRPVYGVRFGPDGSPEIAALAQEFADALHDEREKCAAKCERWATENYPADVFIEPPPGEHGATRDGCSASALRAILPRVAAAIRADAEEDARG